MRIVAWNCCGGFARKLATLEALRPDIAVISEIRQTDLHLGGDSVTTAWIGSPDGGKGLAILGFNGWNIAPAMVCSENWYLPTHAVRGGQHLKILGVWTLPARDYVTPTLRALDELSEFLADGSVVCGGDFNQNTIWDNGKSIPRRFAGALQRLDSLGLKSIWHEQHNEEHGRESAATHFHRWSPENRYHIDYLFASADMRRRTKSMDLGSYSDWVAAKISDHVPIIAEFFPE